MKQSDDQAFETPILFLIFKRPDTTAQVFDAIRRIRPTQLFVAADGPREDIAGEIEGCAKSREIATQVDWPCEVHTLFREENLGCGRGVSGAINWFFDHVSEGIILEDDTLPSPDFFRFCSELLERYRHDTRIMEIGGTGLPSPRVSSCEHSYFFSNWEYIWGWATWRRAWKHFDYSMKLYEKVRERKYFHDQYTSIYEKYFIQHCYDRSYYQNDSVTWWSYQWGFARKLNSGLVVVPTKNMVVNIGIGNQATNTDTHRWDFLRLEDMAFPLTHPDAIMHDRVTDDEIFRMYLTTPSSRFRSRIRQLLEHVGLGKLTDAFRRSRRKYATNLAQRKPQTA